MSELKQEFLQRSITAICLSAVVIALVLFSPNLILNTFVFLLSLALFFEWMKVSESSFKKKIIFLLLFSFLIVCILGIGTLFEPIPFITMLWITIWIVVAYQIFFKEGRLSSNFTFDSGQRGTFYNYGSLIRKSSARKPTKSLKVYFANGYYEASDKGDITTKNSYDNMHYIDDIQTINGIRNTAINKIMEVIGGRKDYKVDCIASEFKDWDVSW